MERCLTEERVTISILKWLIKNGWTIVCYDFPQSGTGRVIYPDGSSAKNKGTIIPDIIAKREDVAVLFENKDRLSIDDFFKLSDVKTSNTYSEAFVGLLGDNVHLFYGVGMPSVYMEEALKREELELIDFVVVVDEENCDVIYQRGVIFDNN